MENCKNIQKNPSRKQLIVFMRELPPCGFLFFKFFLVQNPSKLKVHLFFYQRQF